VEIPRQRMRENASQSCEHEVIVDESVVGLLVRPDMCPSFPTTRRSVVLSLASGDPGERTRAFDTLVALYWRPLYKYARVAWGRSPEDSEDLTQSFFGRMLENEALAAYDAGKASFRTFLRMLFDRYSANEAKAASRIKRGGDQLRVDFESAETELREDHNSTQTPDALFQREWVRSVFAVAVERLRDECEASGRSTHFALFEAYDLDDDRAISYRDLADRHGLSETTVTNHLAATRRLFRQIVLDTLREATASDHEFRAEARALLGVEA
jgi:RNA polymerase sigma factor (sigma-70 family)